MCYAATHHHEYESSVSFLALHVFLNLIHAFNSGVKALFILS